MKELVRDVKLLVEKSSMLKSFVGLASDMARWKDTTPENVVEELFRLSRILCGAFEHLENVAEKVAVDAIIVIRMRHYPPLSISVLGSCAVLFGWFRQLKSHFASFCTALKLYHDLVGMRCVLTEVPELPSPISRLDMEEFLNFCSFGNLHLLNHNLGGGVEVDDEEDLDLKVEIPKWIDTKADEKKPVVTDEDQVKVGRFFLLFLLSFPDALNV